MKYFIILVSLFLISKSIGNPIVEIRDEVKNEVRIDTPVKIKIKQPNLNSLINAMILVESNDNDSAYNDSEKAVGCLQIRPIMLRECNRILEIQKSIKRYTLNDRWDRFKSIEIFRIVSNFHSDTTNHESLARFWNGGPDWDRKNQTKIYWAKVHKKMKI